KCWPLAKFIELARGEGAKGRVPVFILGPEEDEWAAELQAALPGSLFPLQDAIEAGTDPGPLLTIALTAQFKAAVANDSGGGHMLAAGGAPLVSLFGPTRPEKFAPLARRPAIVRAQDFGGAAMEAIPVSAVAAAIDRLLA
ncbi:MAG: lipopolysaccharide heptosyltransferase family protein, partial [Rhodospirillales bacterium]|nr:lipopolysaccharide heptosyltransferase family protein [Rhodospirillales bacterium]